MNMNKLALAMAFVPLTVVSSFAAEHIWNGGSAAAVWDLSSSNWLVGGTPGKFVVGGDAVFNSEANVTMAANVSPASVVVNPGSGETVTWATSVEGPLAGTQDITKKGPGILRVTATTGGGARKYGYDGDWVVQGGTLELSAPNIWTALGKGTIVVGKDSVLKCLERSTLGSPQYGTDIGLDLSGSLVLEDNSNAGNGINAVRTLALNGGTITANSNGTSGFAGVFAVTEKVVVTGDTAQVFAMQNSAQATRRNIILSNEKQLEFHVEDVTRNASVDLTMSGPFLLYSHPNVSDKRVGYKKTGAGAMLWPRLNWLFPNGDIDILGGTVYYPAVQDSFPNNDAVYTIGTGATLVVPLRNQLRTSSMAEGVYPKPVFHVNGGTLRVGGENGQGGEDNWGKTMLFKELYLENGVFDFRLTGIGDTSQGALGLGGLMSLSGTNAYVFARNADKADYNLFLEATEFRVADVTGDVRPDAVFAVKLLDYYDERYNNGRGGTSRAGIIKTGSGTMMVSDNASTFTGDVDIREGTLLLDRENFGSEYSYMSAGYLGQDRASRTVTIAPDATLAVNHEFMTRYWDGVPSEGSQTHYVLKGKLKLADGALNVFHNLTVDGGRFDLGDGYANGNYGNFAVEGTFAVRGDKAVRVSAKLGCANQMFLLGHTNVVFDVSDVTSDVRDDLVFDIPVARPQNEALNIYRWGFTKRGAGTLHLAARDITVARSPATGRVSVEAGSLINDSSLGLAYVSSLAVSAGASIGGVGTVVNLTLASGAGFTCASGQTTPLTVSGDLILPANGFVNIVVPDGMPIEAVKANVVSASGAVSGDLSSWTVKVNGVTRSDCHVSLSGGMVRAGFTKGMAIILR